MRCGGTPFRRSAANPPHRAVSSIDTRAVVRIRVIGGDRHTAPSIILRFDDEGIGNIITELIILAVVLMPFDQMRKEMPNEILPCAVTEIPRDAFWFTA